MLAFLWAILVTFKIISPAYGYFMLGALSTYIGIQNIILLNWSQKSGEMTTKISYLVEKHGEQRGMIQYVIVNVLLFLLAGLGVMYCGYQMM